MLTQRNPLSFAAITAYIAVWMIAVGLVMQHHELWLDEAHQWLLTKDSKTLPDFFYNVRYEGHPPLWDLLLYFVARVSSSFFAMQALHLCFAAGSVFLILRYAPFPVWIKLLLPLAYYFGFEYAVISRNYAPAVFFILLACVYSRALSRNVFKIALLLGVATLFHVYAGVVAFTLLGYFLLCLYKEQVPVSVLWKPIAAFIVLALTAAWFARVPSDHFMLEFHTDSVLSVNRMGTALLMPFSSLMHFPQLQERWWNTNILLGESEVLKAVIGGVFWMLPVLVFRQNRKLMWTYVGGALLLSLVVVLTPMPVALRHTGFLALLFFVCLWRMQMESPELPKLPGIICGVILTVQVASCFVTYYMERERPFSQSKNVAAFIERKYPEMQVAISPQFMGPSVCAYLGRNVYYPNRQMMGSFAEWKSSSIGMDEAETVRLIRLYMKEENLDSMVLVGMEVDPATSILPELCTEVARFHGAAVGSENYHVYIVKPN